MNPNQLNRVQSLEHRLARIAEDIAALRDYIEAKGLDDMFSDRTPHSDEARKHLQNIEMASDLSDDGVLSWTPYKTHKP